MTILSGEPNKLTVIQNGKVRAMDKAIKIHAAKNLPQTKHTTDVGVVKIWTILLDLNSSDQDRIAMAGMNSRYIQG
jgi:hypothetical protein